MTPRRARAAVTVDLGAAGLAHAAGKSDFCGGQHDVDMAAVTCLASPDWVPAADLAGVFQALHAQAHPRGTASWEFCREPGCTAAAELIGGGDD